MLQVLILIIFVVICVCICLHHHNMKQWNVKTRNKDSEFIRIAAESSIIASNTINPIIALVEVTKAVQIVECLHHRYGPDICSRITQVDTQDLLNVLHDQKTRILQDIMKQNPAYSPPHPLTKHCGYTTR